MEENIYTRTAMMLGEEGIEKLKGSHVAVFGVGGVGGFATEALARAGIGKLTLVDSDRVAPSNLNRQIIATEKTIGQYKTTAARDRIQSINPSCEVETREIFFSDETSGEFDFSSFDYVIDAIDSVRSKILLIRLATESNTPIISSMGAGNKLDPTRFRVADISKTHTDPLAKAVRTELRRIGITKLKTVFSDESARCTAGSRTPGSISFVPSAVGLIMAGEVIKDICGINGEQTVKH